MARRLALAVLAALVLTSGTASAARRYATSSGAAMSSGSCATVETACTLPYAVNNAGASDEIDVLSGHYAVTQTLTLPAGAYLHGHVDNLRPRIASSAADVVLQTKSDNTRITDLDISGAAARLLLVNDAGATIDRVALSNTRDGGAALADATISGAITLRSSTLQAVGADAVAGAFQAAVATVRNATFYATGSGARGVSSTCFGPTAANVDMVSSIAHGDGFDVAVERLGCTAAPSLEVAKSSFQTKFEGGGPTVTDGGGNIAADPAVIFVKPGAGDYHELPGAPTIDAGAPADSFSGKTDVDGFEWDGTVPDMGATNFFGASVATPAVSGITQTEAILSALVSATGHSGAAFFEVAPADGLFAQPPGKPSTSVGAGAVNQPVTEALTGLAPATSYRVRLNVAQGNFNYVRTFVSDEVTFTTASPPTVKPRCVVPRLKGLTLKRARVKLRRAHCRLGTVKGRKRGRGTARVRSQKRKVGRKLPAGTKVGVRVRYPAPAPVPRRP